MILAKSSLMSSVIAPTAQRLQRAIKWTGLMVVEFQFDSRNREYSYMRRVVVLAFGGLACRLM
jgi:hypothetical protein